MAERTRSDYEVKYASKNTDGPWQEIWDEANKNSGAGTKNRNEKPAVKGTPHFRYEKASDLNNKPSCPIKNDTYEVVYGAHLSEADFNRPALDVLMEALEQRDQINNLRRV